MSNTSFQIHVPVQINSLSKKEENDDDKPITENIEAIKPIIQGLFNMNFNFNESMSLNQIKDTLRIMAKMEGGIGLDEGVVNFDLVASLIHF